VTETLGRTGDASGADSPGRDRQVRIYLFETGTHVLWAEEVAKENKVPVEVVPAPAGFSNHCGLALQTFGASAPALEERLKEEGIPFRRLA
jgi:hypothetical protein